MRLCSDWRTSPSGSITMPDMSSAQEQKEHHTPSSSLPPILFAGALADGVLRNLLSAVLASQCSLRRVRASIREHHRRYNEASAGSAGRSSPSGAGLRATRAPPSRSAPSEGATALKDEAPERATKQRCLAKLQLRTLLSVDQTRDEVAFHVRTVASKDERCCLCSESGYETRNARALDYFRCYLES